MIDNNWPLHRIVIEGKLIGPWVEELKRCWLSIVSAGPATTIEIELSKMTMIDHEGKLLLVEMVRRGVCLSALGLMSQAIVEEITRLSSEETI